MASVVARPVAHSRAAQVELSTQHALKPVPERSNIDWNSAAAVSDDLSREVYCILGMPIDAIEMPAVIHSIETAAANALPFVISTPNVHFLVNNQSDPEFRESLLLSDLCPADGAPIVWIAWLMGIPIRRRIAGSDILETLKAWPRPGGRLKVFLFGAQENVAAAAAGRLNLTAGLSCVGWICPGWGNVDELSKRSFIDKINSSNADFLMASLGPIKGQLWLRRNHHHLRIPIRAHLGTTINFQAGTVKRAPRTLRKLGLEWLWRIKEEPYLWRRYFYDGSALLQLLVTRILPLAIKARWLQRQCKRRRYDLVIHQGHSSDSVTVSLSGFAVADHIDRVISRFRDALATRKQIVIDFSDTRAVDARFLGLLLMLRKQLRVHHSALRFTGISRHLERTFRANGLGYLLSPDVHEATQDWRPGRTIYARPSPTGGTVSPSMSSLDEETNTIEEAIPAGPTRDEHPTGRQIH
jgi:N-acetylglucosaminyldiphosphoundecaprenol N-acetyl-beta-D-mannosaminyltransferase